MYKDNEENLTELFTMAETDLPGEDFGAQVMREVTGYNRKSALLRYLSWFLMLCCLLSIFPAIVKISIYTGNTMGILPSQFMNFLRSPLDSPVTLIILVSSTGYLIIRFRYFIRLPGINLFGKTRPF